MFEYNSQQKREVDLVAQHIARNHCQGASWVYSHTAVLCAAFVVVLSAGRVHAQGSPTPDYRLSPTLYFEGPSAELLSRTKLHGQVDSLVRSLRKSGLASLNQQLRLANQTLIALRRHSAYLRAKTLDDTQDRVSRDAYAIVSTDEAVLRAAMEARLGRVPVEEIPRLGRYSRLAYEVHRKTVQALAPDVERYRGSVVSPLEQSIADAYDTRMESLGGEKDLTSLERSARRAALSRRDEAYDQAAPAIAELFATLVEVENRDAVAQGFKTAAERKYADLGLSDTLVKQALTRVAAAAPAYTRYEQVVAARAAARLGVSQALSSELSLSSLPAPDIPFTSGRQLILDALRPLGPDYTDRFSRLLDPSNGRLDLASGPNRAHAGTSISAYDAPAALYFTAYDGSLKTLSEIAHEGGHAIHRELMNTSDLPVYERDGPHYLFEGYAIFNELLLLDHAAKVARTPAEREYALERLLAKISLELFTSAEETAFERSVYTAASNHALLTRPAIDEIYAESIRPYETFPMTDVGTSQAWMKKSLLFEDPLYLVNYLYASFVAVALYEKADTDPHFAAKYTTLLRRGFDADPNVLLASVGINLGDPALLDGAVRLFKSRTDELQALYAQDAVEAPSP